MEECSKFTNQWEAHLEKRMMDGITGWDIVSFRYVQEELTHLGLPNLMLLTIICVETNSGLLNVLTHYWEDSLSLVWQWMMGIADQHS